MYSRLINCLRIRLNSLASVMRSVIVAITIAASLPMIDAYGIAETYALCTVLVWISFGYVVFLKMNLLYHNDTLISGLHYIIKYGNEMRAWIDIGFSTVENDK